MPPLVMSWRWWNRSELPSGTRHPEKRAAGEVASERAVRMGYFRQGQGTEVDIYPTLNALEPEAEEEEDAYEEGCEKQAAIAAMCTPAQPARRAPAGTQPGRGRPGQAPMAPQVGRRGLAPTAYTS